MTGQRGLLCEAGEGGAPMRGSQAGLRVGCSGELGGSLMPLRGRVDWLGQPRHRDSRSSPRGSNVLYARDSDVS